MKDDTNTCSHHLRQMKNYSMLQVLEAAEKSDGVMVYISSRLGCWETARRYVDKWEETKEVFAVAESHLHSLAYKYLIKKSPAGRQNMREPFVIMRAVLLEI